MSTTVQTGGPARPACATPSAAPLDLPPKPTQAELRTMGKSEARELSDALFERLAGLARETHAYSYVRGTIIELNMPLVRFIAARFR
ncbi:RNA polymerase sigma factor SigF, partial [Kitasatospora aburaviensis]